jgi:shikimate kinase
MGLPGSGKTTLALELSKELDCVHFNADDIRKNINKDLGFTAEDRVEQASRMGHLCNIVLLHNKYVISDFVCPTEECRSAFNATFTIWMDTIQSGRFQDTNSCFVRPDHYVHVHITSFGLISIPNIIKKIHG